MVNFMKGKLIIQNQPGDSFQLKKTNNTNNERNEREKNGWTILTAFPWYLG